MSIWMVRGVDELPQLTLDAWSVYEVRPLVPGQPWTRHFTGFARETCHGQVSSPVQTFDPVTARGITRSGRVYVLAGRPGLNADAFYVWGRWRTINGITDERDVTDEVWQALQRGSQS